MLTTELTPAAQFVISTAQAFSDDYSDVPIGDPVAFFNTSGYLEIALNLDKASSMLNLLKTETIQINFFE